MAKAASLRPEDFVGRDPHNPAIADQTIDEFTHRVKAPANDDSFFDFWSPPTDWVLAVPPFSRPHLFKHAVCLAGAETNQYIKDKAEVERLSEDETLPDPIQDTITSWLSNRPRFALTRVVRAKRRYQWNTWNKETHRALISLSGDLGVSAVLLFIIYSTKSMATGYIISPHIRKLLERVVEEWDRWLGQETKDFTSILSVYKIASFTYKQTRKEYQKEV